MRLVTCVLITCLGAAPEPPKIHECTDEKGNTVYQDEPCLEPIPVPAKPPLAPNPKPKPASKAKTTPKSKTTPKPAPRPPEFVVPKSRRLVIPSLALPPPGRAVDPRWHTPNTTLETFLEAIEAGDREAIVSCLTASALSDWGPEPSEVPLEALRSTVGSFTGYVPEGDVGPYWSIRALRAGMRPKWIFFERNGEGEWKIGAL